MDPDLLDLHRRRSIHVHRWTPEEFAASLAAALNAGLMLWRLADLYLVDDFEDASGIEFGLVLNRPIETVSPDEASREFVDDWSKAVLANSHRDPHRLVAFEAALQRDIDADQAAEISVRPSFALADEVARAGPRVADLEARLAVATSTAVDLDAARGDAKGRLQEVPESRTHRAGEAIAAALAPIRRDRIRRSGR